MNTEKERYALPAWTGPPPRGTHLDVVKGQKLIQKLLIDEKGHYYFGRSPQDCDFVCEHSSCSRVHSILLYHKLLSRFAIVDLESSHGTFIDDVRIPALSPVFLDHNQCFHFGASTRRYFLRNKSNIKSRDDDEFEEEVEITGGFSQAQIELDSQTEFNTVQNRRIPQIPQTLEEARRKIRPRPRVEFNDDEEVINPEDVDPSVGRFRNMIRTAVIPSGSNNSRRQRDKEDQLFDFYSPTQPAKKLKSSSTKSHNGALTADRRLPTFTSHTLGSLLLNAAPDLDLYAPTALPATKVATATPSSTSQRLFGSSSKPKRQLLGVGGSDGGRYEELHQGVDGKDTLKKYAKEAWPKDRRSQQFRSAGVL